MLSRAGPDLIARPAGEPGGDVVQRGLGDGGQRFVGEEGLVRGDDDIGKGQQAGQGVVLQRQVGVIFEEQFRFLFIHCLLYTSRCVIRDSNLNLYGELYKQNEYPDGGFDGERWSKIWTPEKFERRVRDREHYAQTSTDYLLRATASFLCLLYTSRCV